MPSHRQWLALALMSVAACTQGVESPTAPTSPTDGPSRTVIFNSGTWGTRASMPFPQQNHAVGAANGHIYTIGGFDDNFAIIPLVQEYTPGTDSWRSIAPLPVPVQNAMTATIGTRLYVAGGCTTSAELSQLIYYRPNLDSWAPLASMLNGHCNSPIAVAGGRIYVFGTLTGGDPLASEVYDPAADGWFPITDMPAHGSTGRAVTIDGMIYLFQVVSGVNRLDIFDPAHDVWFTGSVLNAPEPFQFQGSAVAGKFYVLSFFATGSAGYDPVLDQWTAVSGSPSSLTNASSAALGGVIYEPGGNFNSHAVGTVYTFTPAFAGNHLPVVKFTAPLTGKEGTPVHFDGSATSDADGDALAYEWHFGDGVTDTAVAPNHTYRDNGTYAVSLTVTDGVGCNAPGSCTVTKHITVTNVKPTFDPGFTGATIHAFDTYNGSGTFTDLGLDDTFTATVDAGTGFGPQFLPLTGRSFAFSFFYPDPGTYDVTVTITDNDGGSRSETHHVRVLP